MILVGYALKFIRLPARLMNADTNIERGSGVISIPFAK